MFFKRLIILFVLFFHVYCIKKSVFLGNWKAYPPNRFSICNLPIEKIDRIYYIFLNVTIDGCYLADEWIDLNKKGPTDFSDCNSPLQMESEILKGNIYQFTQLKQKYPNKEIIAVIGGYTQSSIMSQMIRDNIQMKKFVKSCVDLYKKYSFVFDGIDIDYEYPCLLDDVYCGHVEGRSSADKNNYYLLINEFRNQIGPNKILTIDITVGTKKMDALDIIKIDPLINSYNIMTYGMTSGTISSYTGHHSQLYVNNNDPDQDRKQISCYSAAKYLEQIGASKNKINIAVPLFGKGFSIGKNSIGNLPFIRSQGSLNGDGFNDGFIDYKDILKKYPDHDILYDYSAHAAYMVNYDKAYFISFDNPMSVNSKRELVLKEGYQGLFGYELTGDTSNFQLLNAMYINNIKSCLFFSIFIIFTLFFL